MGPVEYMKELLLISFYKVIDVFVTWQTILWAEKFYKIKTGDIIFDVGGYFGGFAIYASRKVGNTGKVFCFEPDPKNYQVLKERIKKLPNVILVKKALSDKKSKVEILSNFFSSSVVQKSQKDNNITVETSTLDEETEKYQVKQIDFMKMNIEGAEVEAVRGGQKALKKVRNFVIASHRRDNQNTADILKPVLTELGFKTKIACTFHKNLYGVT